MSRVRLHFDKPIKNLVVNTFSEDKGVRHAMHHTLSGYRASFTIMQIIQRVQLDIPKYILRMTPTDCVFNLNLEQCLKKKCSPATLTALTSFVAHLKAIWSSLTTSRMLPPSLDPSRHTFCHAPRILATSDFLAIHLNHHVTADDCQWHLLLQTKRKTLFFFSKTNVALSGRTVTV